MTAPVLLAATVSEAERHLLDVTELGARVAERLQHENSGADLGALVVTGRAALAGNHDPIGGRR